MKRFFVLSLLICMSFACCVFADDAKPVTVTLNGEAVDCASYGQQATIIEGRTLVPLRAIFEALGASVEWNEQTKTVTSVLEETEIKLTIGKNKLIKNGEEVELDVTALILNGRTMVPVRAISESFGVEVEWESDSRTVALSKKDDESASDGNDKDSLPKTHVYGSFSFGMSIEEAKAAAKGKVKVINTNSWDLNTVILRITDENDEFDDEDWLVTGKLNCESIDFIFKNDILYSADVTIEYQENYQDALDTYEKLTDYYNTDKEIIKVLDKRWLSALKNDVDAGELFENDKLIDFPKKAEKFDSVSCYLYEKKDGTKKIGYYVSFEITNQWYYQHAKKQDKNPKTADLLQKYIFGETKQKTLGVFKGDTKLNGNRVDIYNIDDEIQYVNNDPLHRYYPEKDIYGQGFECEYISLEYNDNGLDKFHARAKETVSSGQAQNSLKAILSLYGEHKAVFHENKNVYEWKSYKYKTYEGTERFANVFAGVAKTHDGNYYCFVSAQPVRDGVYSTVDNEGRIVGTDYPHAYGSLYFGMTMEQASEAIAGEKDIKGSLYRIDVFDKDNAFNDEDESITGSMSFEKMSVWFDSDKKTVCRINACGYADSQEQAEATLESLRAYYGQEDETKNILEKTSYSWLLRGKNTIVEFALTLVENEKYECTFSIYLAGSSIVGM